MWVATADLPQGGGHPFYERLNQILNAAGFDAFVEKLCAPFYARMLKDGRTHLAHKAEHAVDLETGAVVSVTVQDADDGDTTTMVETLITAPEQLAVVADAGLAGHRPPPTAASSVRHATASRSA